MEPSLEQAVARYVAGNREPDILDVIVRAAQDDAEFRGELRDTLALDRMLRELQQPGLDKRPVLAAIRSQHSQALRSNVMDQIQSAPPLRRYRHWQVLAVAAGLLVACLGVDMTLRGGLGMQPATIVRISALTQVHWTKAMVQPPEEGARLGTGPFELLDGLVELTYDNGARLLIQGPARLDLQSAKAVHLVSGRLAATIPTEAHGFTVSVGRMAVVDLGTEFAMGTTANGQAEVQVYTGRVTIGPQSSDSTKAVSLLTAGHAIRIDPQRCSQTPIPFSLDRFTRFDSTGALRLEVADIIAGGNGLGNAAFSGIDPRSGIFSVDGSSLGLKTGDTAFQHADGQSFVDGVFIPHAKSYFTIDSVGDSYLLPGVGDSSYDIIRRGGFLIKPPDAGYSAILREPSIIDGVDYAKGGHTLIGFHANAGMTIDLQAIDHAFAGHLTRFTTLIANTAARGVAPGLSVDPATFLAHIRDRITWSPLTVTKVATQSGTHLAIQSDGSVLASAPARTDIYTLTTSTTLTHASALRLDMLTDPSLPSHGPGTNVNGNFVLSKIRMEVIGSTHHDHLNITGAVADFSQSGWLVGDAVTGTGPHGWGVIPLTGAPHTAIFYFDPVAIPAGGILEINLDQLQAVCDHHLLGHFRLSLTDDPDPVKTIAVGAGSVLVLVDGRLIERTVVPLSDQRPARVDIPLTSVDHFLTLISADGGYSNGFQWTTLADPQLTMTP